MSQPSQLETVSSINRIIKIQLKCWASISFSWWHMFGTTQPAPFFQWKDDFADIFLLRKPSRSLYQTSLRKTLQRLIQGETYWVEFHAGPRNSCVKFSENRQVYVISRRRWVMGTNPCGSVRGVGFLHGLELERINGRWVMGWVGKKVSPKNSTKWHKWEVDLAFSRLVEGLLFLVPTGSTTWPAFSWDPYFGTRRSGKWAYRWMMMGWTAQPFLSWKHPISENPSLLTSLAATASWLLVVNNEAFHKPFNIHQGESRWHNYCT